jgi:transcriptional regulator with XRE-family HTH domain
MSVAVYPRLGELLRARDLTVAELGRQINLRFGLTVDSASLDQWSRDLPVQRADLELAGAAAAILDVSLADLFEVDLAPSLPPEDALLEERDAERLSVLLEKQQAVGCTEAEQAEIRALVAEFSRRARELGLEITGVQHGISVEQARHNADADLEEARQWWTAFQGDPERRQAVVADLKRRRRRAALPT